ncbi:protein KASH5 isoform X3 [Artibeus jamaicensis]|uniref:protein KASH5 isoform X3 n=1 Tax=Artibeus jamaicensis TaxID=9417 RepID=UPI00235AF8E6|nr:protein KASH5 isoform X3 [Artibeus jamaicensis]
MDLPENQADGPASQMYLWDQPEEGLPGTPLSSEEQILKSTFEACDPQRTGFVAVTHVLAYLEAVTGQGCQDTRLQTLACSLDPSREGPQATVDLDTFLVVMRDWIAACQLDGRLELEEETAFEGALTSQRLPSGSPNAEEPDNLESFGGEDPRPELPGTADLLSSLEDLELNNRRLAGENAKLQRSVETAEEGSARLGEEISALRKQLRSTQQALQLAKAVDEELEDLKSLAKSLEEQNRGLLAQARQTNGKLLAERDRVKRRTEELAVEKDSLKRQLCECEHLICQREADLSERACHAESLAKTLEEYRTTTQELKLEISHLEEQLSQIHKGPDEPPKGTQARREDWAKLLPPSLGMEIRALQQKQEEAAADLSSPLCGVWQWQEGLDESSEEAEGQRNFQGEPAYRHEGRKGQSKWLPRREEEEEAETRVVQPCRTGPAPSPGACGEEAGSCREAGLGPALPVPPAPPRTQGRWAPADPRPRPGPAAAAAAAVPPAARPVPAPHLAAPPALLPAAASRVSPSEQRLVQLPGGTTPRNKGDGAPLRTERGTRRCGPRHRCPLCVVQAAPGQWAAVSFAQTTDSDHLFATARPPKVKL